MSATSEQPLVEVLEPSRGAAVSPAQEEAQHPAASEGGLSAREPLAAAPPPPLRAASPPRRGRLARAAGATARGAARGLRMLLRFLLSALVFCVFALLRLLQLAAFVLTVVGLPYALSGPVTLLAVAASAALLLLKVPFGGVRTPGRAAAAAADAALLALAGAMLADHCGCRGGAPLPAAAYKAARRASLATMHLAHAPGPAELAYHAYTAACDLVC